MNSPPPSSSVSSAGRSTGIILSLVLFLCLALIGFSGFVKYQLDRAETTLTASDAAPTERTAAQNELKSQAMLLTFIAWASLVIAASCAAGIYLAQRSRQSAPIRALAQSVQNLAQGDMRTPVWGMERADSIGELARAIDLARYHFSQLPDMSILSEQGPMRIRFEGAAQSLFEAMMQNITRDSEAIRHQASSLAEAIDRQKEAIAHVSGRVENALSNMYHERRDSEQHVMQLLQTISGSAQTLTSTQQTAAAQLTQLVNHLRERASGMSEITQIAGRQVALTLQSLVHTEHDLRTSAVQSKETVNKLAASGNELSERMFGAVTLLRAGGKVLTETAEATQSRLNEAIHLLSQSESSLRQMLVQGFEPVGNKPVVAEDGEARREEAARLQLIMGGLEAAQQKLEECLAQQSQATQAQIDLLTTQSTSLLTQASTTAQTLASVTDHLRNEQDRLGHASGKMAETLESIGGRLEQRALESFARTETAMRGLTGLTELVAQLGPMIENLSATALASATEKAAVPEHLLAEIRNGFETSTRTIEHLREEFTTLALKQPVAALPAFDLDELWTKIAAQLDLARDNLTRMMIQQTDRIEVRIAAMEKKAPVAPPPPVVSDVAPSLLQKQTEILSELAAALGAIDAHMQEMETTFKNFSKTG